MPKDTKSSGYNKAPACESRGFVRKRKKGCILTHLLYALNALVYMVQLNGSVGISLKTWGNLFFFVENTVELLKKNYICTIHY